MVSVSTSQSHCSIVRKCVWIQKYCRFCVETLLNVHHTLILKSCVVEVKVPATWTEQNHIEYISLFYHQTVQGQFKTRCLDTVSRRLISPVPPLKGTAVLGVIVQLSHALFEQIPNFALF